MPDSNIWTINDAPAADNNLAGLGLTILTQSPDQLKFTQTTDYDADPLYDYLDKVTLKRDGARFFEGQITDIRRSGSAQSERIDYTVNGPWWQLEQIIVEQDFVRRLLPNKPQDRDDITEGNVTLARLILGTDINGARLHSGEVITEFVNYALTKMGEAALFQLGTVGIDTEFPFEEVSTITAAEAISRVLRYNPDVVESFDYSTNPATLNFQRRAALTAKSYNLAAPGTTITDNAVNPRNDLQKDGVIVKYERVNSYDAAEYTEIIEDSAGDVSDPFKTLKLYYNLQGEQVSLTKQRIVTETIQKTSGDWWKKQLPHLAEATGITVTNATQTPVDDGAENDGSEHSRQLITGSIAPWMNKETCDQIIKGDLSYTLDGVAKTETGVTFRLVGTNATSNIYTDVSSFTAGEAAPEGLAASILASISTLNYEGTLTLKDQDTPAESIINKKVNINGGRTEWESMAAQIYRVTYDIDTGSTSIAFGPARHLAPDDIFALYRNTRQRKPSGGFARRGNSATESELPNRSPNTIASGSSTGADTVWKISNDNGELSVAGGYVFGSSLSTTPVTVAPVSKQPGDKVWIKISSNNGYVLTDAEIEVGSDWPSPLVGTTIPYFLYVPIGQVVEGDVHQWRRDHLYLAVAHGTPGPVLIPR